MNSIRKKAIAGLAVLGVLSAAGYGLWFAWDSGALGDNPRAPVAAAMESAVRKQALINMMTREQSEPCINIDLNRPAPEISGAPGISLFAAPGRYAVSLLKQTNSRDQPAREIQLGQMDYLATQGLLTASDGALETDGGPRPARNYQLTWAGYAALQQNYGASLCLPYGRREFAGIEHIEKLLEKMLALDVYEVGYLTRIADIPAWASTPEAARLFPKLAQLTAETKGKAKIIRTGEGWRSAYEIEMEASQAAKGAQAGNHLKDMMKSFERPIPTLDEAKALAAGQAADTNWASRNSMACLPLQLQRGGDDKPAPGANNTGEFTVTYYDRSERKEYEHKTLLKALHILSALEGAGLAQMEQIKPPPTPPTGKGMKNAAPQAAPTRATGLRFVVFREAVEAIGLDNGSGCLPAGRLKVEVLAVRGFRGAVQMSAKGVVEQTPDWVARIAERLPALKSLIENGVPMSGQLTFATEDVGGKWRLSGLSPGYPDISHNTLPAHLAPLMSLTATAFPAKSVKAPALVPDLPSSPLPPSGGQPAPSAPVATAPATAAPASIAPSQTSAPPAPAPAPLPAPLPAAKAPVHVVSIYQASLPGGAQRGFQQHPEGVANITVDDPDSVLLLFAYEPVEWRITAPRGISLKRVVATGHHDQRVTLNGGGKPEVVVSRRQDILRQAGINLNNGFPTRQNANDLVDIATISQALTGSLPRSYQGSYEAPAAGFSIGSQTPRFALPARQTPDSASSPVTLHSPFSESAQGNRLLRGSAGAYTDAWSDRAYSGGKVYFEGKMRVSGALAGHTHANIGLCLSSDNGIESSSRTTLIRDGEQKLYKDGDLFGIAADFDQQRLYYRVNGAWITGAPGSGTGIPLEKSKAYRACLFAAGTTSGDVKEGKPRSDTTWEVNFGDRPFNTALPAGFTSFQGKSSP